jgi:hypothetical protein
MMSFNFYIGGSNLFMLIYGESYNQSPKRPVEIKAGALSAQTHDVFTRFANLFLNKPGALSSIKLGD